MDERSPAEEGLRAIKLYADENFPLPVVQELRRLGCDVSTVHEAGQGGRRVPDDEVLAFAHSNQRAVITHNRRDFIQLHKQSTDHSGIIVCTVDPDHVGLASRIDRAIGSSDSLVGQLIRIIRPPA